MSCDDETILVSKMLCFKNFDFDPMEVLAYFVLYFVLTSSSRGKAIWCVIPSTKRVPQVYFRKFPSLAKRVKKIQTPLGRRGVSSWAISLFFPEFKRSFQETVPAGCFFELGVAKIIFNFLVYLSCTVCINLSVQFLRFLQVRPWSE